MFFGPTRVPLTHCLPGATEEAMNNMKIIERHSENILKPGVYIELVDLLLWCQKIQVKPVFYLNTVSEINSAKPVEEFLSGVLGPSVQNWWGNSCPTVTFALTRADFEPSNDPHTWNHWIVCFDSGDFSFDDRFKILLAEVERLSAAYEGAMQQAEDDAVRTALMADKELAIARIRQLQKFTMRLHAAANLIPCDVGADGNCGIYALMSLMSADGKQKMLKSASAPALDSGSFEDMQTLRAALCSAWRAVASDPLWGYLFASMATDVANPPAPATPERDAMKTLFKDFTPPRVPKPAAAIPGAGLVRPRLADGPSLPLSRKLPTPARAQTVQPEAVGATVKKELQIVPVKQEILEACWLQQEGGLVSWWQVGWMKFLGVSYKDYSPIRQ